MGLIRFLATYLMAGILLSLAGTANAQVGVDTLGIGPTITPADTVGGVDSTRHDTTAIESQEPQFEVIPWRYNHSIDGRLASSDSLLRWQNWPDWTYKKNRDPGVFSFRLGTVGRSSALMIDAHEPRHQALFWEDIPMHNQVSGTVNWNVLPIHKIESIYEQRDGITHQTNFQLKQYYVNKPMTKLIFDESKFNRRALEFWVTQNFSQKTNAELSYWDRRGGGGYPNSTFNGSQIFGRVYHQMNNQQFFKLRFLNGKRTLGEPFGYAISDLRTFPFNRFSAIANQPSGRSESKFSTLALSYHQRPADTAAVPEKLRGGLFLNNQEREVTYSADTTFYKVQSVGAFAHKWFEWHPFTLEGEFRYELFSNRDPQRSSVDIDNWQLLSASGRASFEPVGWTDLQGAVEYKKRSDNYSRYSLGADLELNIANRLTLSGGASRGTTLPTMQQLYWSSNGYSGSQDLEQEEILEAHGQASYTILEGLNAGVKGQYKKIDNGVFLNSQNQFVNVGDYGSASLTGFADFENPHFEIAASGTIHQYQNATFLPSSGVPAFSTTRIWTRGSAYWKGYVFNRAAYVKIGVAGMLSPFTYRAEHYDAALDYWQPAGQDQRLPWFSRMDVDLSVRVRSIMFVMRFENVLDDVNQLGYFETANYPMPPRQFLFGVRAIFNN